MKKIALVAGATGLVGQHLLELLLQNPYYHTVVSLTRSYLDIKNERLLQLVLEDYEQMHEMSKLIGANDVYCCLGTTMKKAGSKAAFRKVDYEYALRLANIAKQNHAQQFLLVSSVGAKKGAGNFYLGVKGELEEAVNQLGYEAFHAFRPSFILGNRQEKRTGEGMGKKVSNVISPLMVGGLKKFKPIQAKSIAQAMLGAAQQQKGGQHIYHYTEINALAAKAS